MCTLWGHLVSLTFFNLQNTTVILNLAAVTLIKLSDGWNKEQYVNDFEAFATR